MRIVGGRHRGKRIAAPPGAQTRPTSDRAREAVFNILSHGGFGAGGASVVVDAAVLDAFCGTGAMGLEALSRGAARAVFIDREPAALAALRANIRAMGEDARARVLVADALAPPLRPADMPAATLAFFDPPYAARAVGPALAAFAASRWFAGGALCVAEESARDPDPVAPAGFTLLDVRRYGAARILLLRFAGPDATDLPQR